MNTLLVEKLHPKRFPGMSGRMAAIVGFILGQDWSVPRIVEVAITSDGYVLAREKGDVGLNVFIGSTADLEKNWRNLLESACLLPDEKAEISRLYRARIQDHRSLEAEVS
mgnify:CR=1 FL=1